MLDPILSYCVFALRASLEEFVAKHSEPVFVLSFLSDDGADLAFQTLAPGPVGAGSAGRTVAPITKRPGANHFDMMITIGRAKNNDIQIPAAEVSKFHAYVTFNGGQASLTDAGSTWGTRIGERVLEPRTDQVVLSDGDKVYLGSVELTYLSPSAFYAFLLEVDDWKA